MSTPSELAAPESFEEREARAAPERKDPAVAARRLLRGERQGTLSTLSLHRKGWPFGSLAPYALSARGEPLLLLSALAQHTKNALADSRASLLVQESAGLALGADAQAHGRVTLLGRIAAIDVAEEDDVRARYLARHPNATRTAGGHDFRWYTLSIEEARFIGGFGEICWVPGSSMLLEPSMDPLLPHRERICRHMNDDHADALALFCQCFRGLSGQGARMLAVDAFGFDVQQGAAGARSRVRFEFAETVSTPDEVRRAMVQLAKAAKAHAR